LFCALVYQVVEVPVDQLQVSFLYICWAAVHLAKFGDLGEKSQKWRRVILVGNGFENGGVAGAAIFGIRSV
jgi:hypothetical protein